MADDLYAVHDTRLAAIDRVLVHAGRVVHHWDEFGPGSDFEQEMVILAAALRQWNRFWLHQEPRSQA